MASNELTERAEEIEILVLKSQKGDKDSFAKLYDIFIDPIYRYVYYRVHSCDAEDLVETVFLKVWENIHQYKKKKYSFSSWVFRIAHNLVVDYYRAAKSNTMDELNEQLPDVNREHNPIKNTQNALTKEALKKAISRLKKNYQEIIVHKFINELTNQELAEILDQSEGSLRILQHRALKALRRELEEMGLDQ
jgi:RNA polymerase sigma-70 factor, ECF subfamily